MAMPLENLDINDADFASHHSTPASVLHRLSHHADVEVRMAVADNKSTHPITTMQLAKDNNPDLRYALAENHQIDSMVLDILAKDENPFVADRALKTLSRLKQAIPDQSLSEKMLPNSFISDANT